jgi:hypothetical protein
MYFDDMSKNTKFTIICTDIFHILTHKDKINSKNKVNQLALCICDAWYKENTGELGNFSKL